MLIPTNLKMANGEEIVKFLEEELEEFEKLYRELMGKNLKICFIVHINI